jgi:hypothetical protein
MLIYVFAASMCCFYVGYFVGAWFSRVAIDDAERQQAVSEYRQRIKPPIKLPTNWGEG